MIPISVEATIGVIDSGTAGTIDRTVWDRSTSFVVDLLPAHALSSTTEADVVANPELNLACIGSGTTYYVFQFTTVSAGTPSDPYQARYTVSGFLWDRFGSGAPPAGSLAGLNFVLLNSAIKPVAVPLEDLNVPRNYKAATSGQSTDDAETVSFTLSGNSLRPLPPANLRGARNGAGDLLIQWTRRERIGAQLRDYAGTPRNEEAEIYVIEIYSGATLKRTVRNPTVLAAAPVEWQALYGAADLTVSADGSIAHAFVDDTAVARSAQEWAGNFVLEFEYPAGGDDPPLLLGVFDAAAPWDATQGFSPANGAAYFEFGGGDIRPNGLSAYGITPTAGDLFVLKREGDIIRFYLNPHLTCAPAPFYETSFGHSGRFLVSALFQGGFSGGEALKVRLGLPLRNAYHYTVGAQEEDFGSAQSSVKVRVYQESAIVGKGYYAEATL